MQLMDTSSPDNSVHVNFTSNLESTLIESLDSLYIQDSQNSVEACEVNHIHSVTEENLIEGIKEQERKQIMMCLEKSASFPIPHTMLPSNSFDEEVDTLVTGLQSELSALQTYSRSVSLPTPLKLISAMKGSRERNGGPQLKLSVKWAPDVYDPVPTLVSHTVKSKKQQKSRKKKTEKKNGKKGQKGSSSRGGSSKDKKHFRKLGGTSDLCYKSVDFCDKVIETSTELDALDVRSHDSYCGTSFLKKSVTEVHYSVAEAL